MGIQPLAIQQNELIALLKRRDKSGMDYLYENYSAALFGHILRIVTDKQVAEEVLHDAFLKIWNGIDSYDASRGRLFTWMLNLSRNLAIDKLRSKEIKKEQKTDQVENNVSKIEQNADRTEPTDLIGVKDLVDGLREEERLVVNMVYFKGYTQAEVSEETEIPLGTVKTRLRMALKNLRSIVGKE